MHRASIIPHDQIIFRPSMAVYKFRLYSVLKKIFEDSRAFRDAHAEDVFCNGGINIQSPAAGLRMRQNWVLVRIVSLS